MKAYDPQDIEAPSPGLWATLALRLSDETGLPPLPPAEVAAREPEWEEAAPRIWVKILARDVARNRVSMLVRLEPGTDYPPHTHAGLEELHLLHGELWIDDNKLVAGDYNRAEPGTGDKRVWSQAGCTCVLVTSPDDVLG